MAQNYKKLLTNIYYASKYFKESNNLMMNDLMRDDIERKHSKGQFDAYSYIVQMIEYSDTIGSVDYKKTFKMNCNLPDIKL